MAFTTPETEALARLPQYNKNTFDASTNPYGLGGVGYKDNIPGGNNDVAIVGGAVAREAQAAVDSAAAASTSESNAAASESGAGDSETAAQAAQTAAETARDQAQAAAGSVTALNNLNATTDPTANHDSVDTAAIGTEFSKGSIWINTNTSEVYRCIDDTPTAAVWILTTLTVDELGGMATQEANAVAITGGTIAGIKRRGYGRQGFVVSGTLTNITVPTRFYAETNLRIHNMKFQTDAGTVDVVQSVNGADNIGFGAGPSDTVSVTTTLTEVAVNEDSNAYVDLNQGDYIEVTLSNVSSATNLLVLMDAEDNR